MAKFVHEGKSVDYTPGSAVTGGDVVVQGDLIGVSPVDITAGELGALTIEGVFDFPKGAGAIAAGVLIYWNSGASQATTTASGNKLIGKAVDAAADGDTTVRGRLTP